jgi:hypothetical protein
MGLSPGFGGIDQPPDFTFPFLADLFALITAVFNALLRGILFLLNVLISLIRILVTVFRTIAKFLHHIWENYVKAAIRWLASHVLKLRAWLKRTIGPILKRLQKIKQWYDEHILKQQLRLLQMIQRIRRILGILRLFHIKWAAKLDNVLADVQNRIRRDIALIRGTLNQIINTLALAFDPTLIIRRNALGASLLSMLGAVKRIFGYGSNRPLTAKEQAQIQNDSTRYYKSNVDTYVKTLVTTGPTDEDIALAEEARLALERATNVPIPI